MDARHHGLELSSSRLESNQLFLVHLLLLICHASKVLSQLLSDLGLVLKGIRVIPLVLAHLLHLPFIFFLHDSIFVLDLIRI